MDGQQQPSPLEQLLLLNQVSQAFDSLATNVSATRSIDFGKVISFELTEAEDKTPVAVLIFADGAELEISPEEFKTYFRPFWNIKTKVDGRKLAFASAIFNQMFADEQK